MEGKNKQIAKNTLFLYIRMMLIMLVSLYTSRVILDVLGINDFGIYQSVAGVVSMLAFVNSALSTGSSRFLTYEMGRGDKDRLSLTFSTILSVHILLALIVILIAETVGLWFVYNKLVIAPERLEAAVFAYHTSIIASFFTITQVPYTAAIISHEKMGVYAYVSIVEVMLKLLIVYLLMLGDYDKLKLYSVLFLLVQVGIALYYRWYVIRIYKETHYKMVWDKKILKEVLSYSGWNLFANTSIALNNQGAIILLNMFFSPAVVSARAIANQVSMVSHQFINNFRTAFTPQVVKRYASGDLEKSQSLLLASTKYSYYMVLVLCLPLCLVTDTLLSLWLKEVPEYTDVFLRLAIITSLFQVFDSSFYTALYAKGQIRENALTGPTLGIFVFPIVYVLFYIGMSPVALAWALLVLYMILGLVQKPALIIKIAGYRLVDILDVFITCAKVTIASLPVPIIIYIYRESIFCHVIIQFFALIGISVLSVLISIWYLGLDSEAKTLITKTILSRLHRIY